MTAINPNHYDLLHGKPHDEKYLNVSYDSSGIDGKPRFAYKDKDFDLQFTGDQIRTVVTEIGTIVTVTLKQTVDSGSTTFSLLVPNVNLDKTHRKARIKTEGITTIHRFVIKPLLNQEQSESYTVTKLTGEATSIETI